MVQRICIRIDVLQRSLELPGSIAPFLQVSSPSADNARLLAEHQVRLFHFFKSTKTFSPGIFALLNPRRAHSFQAIFELVTFSCHNAAQVCILQPFLAVFYCNLPALGSSHSISRWLKLRICNFLLIFCCLFLWCWFVCLIVVYLLDCCCWFHLLPLFAWVCY